MDSNTTTTAKYLELKTQEEIKKAEKEGDEAKEEELIKKFGDYSRKLHDL